jgi:ribosomal protein S18 acetylase RimI-like enzyme
MIRPIRLKTDDEINQLLTLQRAAYQVEADLIGFYDIPPLYDNAETLLSSHETFFGFYIDDRLVGVISYQLDGQTLDIFRLCVDPACFRRGIARALLDFVEHAESGVTCIIVSTGSLNTPARQLYERHGFTRKGEQSIAEGVRISHYEKQV